MPLYLKLERLETHLHVIGPPGCGKSRFLLGLFQTLCGLPGATIVLINPKGRAARLARDWMIERRMAHRMVWFDPGDPQGIAGYNPMAANGLPVSTHAKSVRDSIRSAFGQSSFDQTPQLARFLFLALAIARGKGWGLVEAMRILQPGSRIREELLNTIDDPMLRESLTYFHSLKANRQEELVASSLARLEAFVCDETIRRVLIHQPALSLGDVMDQGRVLLVNLELNRPLRIDDVKLLGRFIVNDLLNHVFERPEGERRPVFLLLDEAQLFATADLCSALDLGREVGLHCVLAHQHLGQLRDEEKSGYLYNSVMTCARTKAIFGGLSVEDLEVLTKEVAIDQFNPMAIKDELTTFELDPIETSRLLFSFSAGYGRANSETHTASKARTKGSAHSEFSSSGSTVGMGSAISSGHSTGAYAGVSGAGMLLAGGDVTLQQNAGTSSGDFTSTTDSHTESISESSGVHDTTSESETEGTTVGTSTGGTSAITMTTARVPFYEYAKRRNVSSRTFVSEAEYLTTCLQKIKAQPQAHFVLKVENHPAIFCQAPFVGDPKISLRRRAEALAQMFSEPFYLPAADPKVRTIPATPYRSETVVVEFSETPPATFLEEE